MITGARSLKSDSDSVARALPFHIVGEIREVVGHNGEVE